MPVSRPLLVALVGAVLALAAFYATSGARNSSDDGGSAPTATKAEPSKSSKDAAASDTAKSKPTSGSSSSDSGSSKPVSKSDAAGTAVPARVARALGR